MLCLAHYDAYSQAGIQFDAFHAPWTISSLPVTPKTHPIVAPPLDPFLADLRPRTLAQTIVHMGRRIEVAPPILTHAAIFSFFFRVEQDTSVIAELTLTTPPPAAGLPLQLGVGTVSNAAPPAKPAKTSLPVLKSKIHDRDFARMASCVDPYSSRGLPTLACRGELNGSWEGRFSFFDFDSYRDMLGGRMRSLYEGPFGDQPQVWKIEEKVVRLTKGEKQGGRGSTLNAGYEKGQMGPRATFSQSPPYGTVGLPSGSSTLGSRRKSADLGTGEERASKRNKSVEEDFFGEREDEDDDGDYEILLTGSVRLPVSPFLASHADTVACRVIRLGDSSCSKDESVPTTACSRLRRSTRPTPEDDGSTAGTALEGTSSDAGGTRTRRLI